MKVKPTRIFKMLNSKKLISPQNILKIGLATGLIGSCFYLETLNNQNTAAASGLQFRWDGDNNYIRLKYLQTAKEKAARSTYYFLIRKNERKTAMLKLSLKFPSYFKATIKPKNITLCKMKLGGYSGRTRCLEKLPATVEIDEKMQNIDIYPNTPIPVNKSAYGVVLKMFNPRQSGMYQINTFSQSPGELPISTYVGSYLIDIE